MFSHSSTDEQVAKVVAAYVRSNMDIVIIPDYSSPNLQILGCAEVTSLEESVGQVYFEACIVAYFGPMGTNLARMSGILEACLACPETASLAAFEDYC